MPENIPLDDIGKTICIPALFILEDKNILTVGAWTITESQNGEAFAHGFIRKDRYSSELLDDIKKFTIAIIDEVSDLAICGHSSGEEVDKFYIVDCEKDDGYMIPKEFLVAHKCEKTQLDDVADHILLTGKVVESINSTKDFGIVGWSNDYEL